MPHWGGVYYRQHLLRKENMQVKSGTRNVAQSEFFAWYSQGPRFNPLDHKQNLIYEKQSISVHGPASVLGHLFCLYDMLDTGMDFKGSPCCYFVLGGYIV